MSSFFLKTNNTQNRKRKFHGREKKIKNHQKIKLKQVNDDADEEIPSENEEISEDIVPNLEFSDDEEKLETPQDKRLKLAKKYLSKIELEEKNHRRIDSDDINDNTITQRLTNDYMDSIGKLKRKIADSYIGYDPKALNVLKHKLHKLPVTCVCLSQDNKYLFTGSKNQFIVKWDFSINKPIGSINLLDSIKAKTPGIINTKDKKPRPYTVALAITSDFRFLAVANGSTSIHIFSPDSLEFIHSFEGHRDIVTALVFRKDSHDCYSTSKDRSVKIWSLDKMEYIETLFGHQSHITSIDALSRERAITSGGSDRTIRIWKITEETQLIFTGHKGNIEHVKLINEENFLSSSDDGSLCVWSAMRKKPICSVDYAHGISSNGEANWISAIATNFNTDVVASGSCDGLIKLWKLSDHYRALTLLFEIPVTGFVNSLAFTADGSHLVAGLGQEHRLGRWWKMKDGINSVIIVNLERKK